MANRVSVRTDAPGAKQATGEIKGLRDGLDRLQKQGAKGFGLGVGASVTTAALGAVTGALGAVGDGIQENIKAASDLNESASKSKVVFGEAADEMDEFGAAAAQNLGLSKQAALEAGATFGNFFTGLGQGQEEAAAMSKRLVGLAGDLASFNNLDTTDALDKLRAGLAGEAEPLRRVGVFLTEAKVKAKAMELGLADAHGELSEGAKVMARYQLILDETKTAQGDFARTSEGLANQQRITNAELENTKAQLGQDLLPAQLNWEKGNLDVIRSIRALNDITKAGEVPRQQLIDDFRSVLRTVPGLPGPLGEFADSILEGEDAARKADRALDNAARAAVDWGDAADDAKPPTNDLRDEIARLRTAANQADDAIDDMSDTLSTELFGDAITTGNIARLNETYDELIKQRDGAKKGSREYKILTGEIAENRQELFNLQLQMKEEEGPEAVLAWLRKQKRLYGDATGAIQRLIDKYKALSRIQGSLVPLSLFGGKIRNLGTFADGGRPKPGEPAIVGEEGPELFVPDRAGTIIPNDALGAGRAASGAGVTININSTWPPTAAQARDIANTIARELQRSGHLRAA